MTEKKLRMAIYCRVSTEQQTTENQKIILEKYAKQKGWDYQIFEETMSSRKTRPVKQRVMAKLRSKELDGVLVLRLDRWARSSRELILEMDEFVKKEIIFNSYNDNINLSSAMGKLQFQMLSAFAEFERNLISDRTKEGLARAKMQGKILGRPKGSKDRKKRKRSGYIMKEAYKKQQADEKRQIYHPIEYYINNPIKGLIRTNPHQ